MSRSYSTDLRVRTRDSRLAYARLSAVATASRLPTANRGSNNSYTTSWDTTWIGPILRINHHDFGRLKR